jgi:DNA-binding HxlR family transcriptional regulator
MEMNTNGVEKLRTRTKAEESLALCGDAHPVLCMRAALRLITGKWKAEIMWSLKDGKRRFGELMRGIPGITQHMLTAQLRDMENHGLITRTVYAEVPPRVEYELTPAAYGLKPVFEALSRWAEEHAETLRLGEADDEEGEGVPKS